MLRQLIFSYQRLRRLAFQLGRDLFILRAVMAFTLAAGALLSLPAQTIEIYRILAQDPSGNALTIATFAVALIFAGDTNWRISVWLTLAAIEDGRLRSSSSAVTLRIITAIITVVPLVIVALACLHSAEGDTMREYAATVRALHVGSATSATLAVVFGTFCFRRTRSIFESVADESFPSVLARARRLARRRIAAGLTIVAWFCFAPSDWASTSATAVGVAALVALWQACFAAIGGGLSQLAGRLGFPVLGVLVAGAIAFSAMDTNDNHRVRTLRLPDPESRLPQLSESFDAWMNSRRDIGEYDRYPVIIVAAEGGGIYAAYFASLVLSRLQDLCPKFAHHVFAISGVSGGSLGAALFTSLLSNTDRKLDLQPCVSLTGSFPTPLADRAQRYLRQDLLAPVIAAALFPDFIQRFLPVPIGGWDRARAFENSMENAWQEVRSDQHDVFSRPFVELRRDDDSIPYLVLNTTVVGTGMRSLIAEFDLGRYGSSVMSNSQMTPTLRLSTAVGISARFPGVMPAAWVDGDVYRGPDGKYLGPRKVRLVDGGYFENSGAATAFDLWIALQDIGHEGGRAIDVVVLEIGSASYLGWSASDGLGEMLSPIRTLFNTRGARGETARRQLAAVSTGASTRMFEGNHFKFTLSGGTFSIPLGWRLSRASEKIIEQQSGSAWSCDAFRTSFGPAEGNDCAAWGIHHRLSQTRSAIGLP